VMNQPRFRPPLSHRHLQCRQDQFGPQMVLHRLADQAGLAHEARHPVVPAGQPRAASSACTRTAPSSCDVMSLTPPASLPRRDDLGGPIYRVLYDFTISAHWLLVQYTSYYTVNLSRLPSLWMLCDLAQERGQHE
jgi:hypothetical protein